MAKYNASRGWCENQLGSVYEEMAKLAYICGVKLLDRSAMERVINGDEGVCARPNPEAFRKLRGLLNVQLQVAAECMETLGPTDTTAILDSIKARLRARSQLGGEEQ